MATSGLSLAALLQLLQGGRSTYVPVAPSPALPSLQTIYPNAVFNPGVGMPGPPVLSLIPPGAQPPQQPKPGGSSSSTRPFHSPPQPKITQPRLSTPPIIRPGDQPPIKLPQPGGPSSPTDNGTNVTSTITFGGEVTPGSGSDTTSVDSTGTTANSDINYNGQVDPNTGAVWTVDPNSGVGSWVDPNTGDVVPSDPNSGAPGDSVAAQPIDTTSPGFDTGSGYVSNPNYQGPDTSGGYIDTSGGSYIDYGGGSGLGGGSDGGGGIQMSADLASAPVDSAASSDYNYFG